jgi:hypothetical protein
MVGVALQAHEPRLRIVWRRLTLGDSDTTEFSPKDDRVLHHAASGQISVLDETSGQPTPLSEADYRLGRLSPDAQWIALANQSVVLRAVKSGTVVKRFKGYDQFLWRSDGALITFRNISTPNQPSDLCVWSPPGWAKLMHRDNLPKHYRPTQISDNGRCLIYIGGEQVASVLLWDLLENTKMLELKPYGTGDLTDVILNADNTRMVTAGPAIKIWVTVHTTAGTGWPAVWWLMACTR